MKNFKLKGILASAAVIGVTALGSASNAATVTGTCDEGNKYISLTSVAANDSNNVYCQKGNYFYGGAATPTLTFGGTTYTLAVKSDAGNGDGAHSFASFGPNTWALNDVPSSMLQFVIGIKEGNTYGAFLVNAVSGSWFTAKSSTDTPTAGVSHYDLWYAGSAPAPVPVPAAAWMLVLGLGGLTALKRRKKS